MMIASRGNYGSACNATRRVGNHTVRTPVTAQCCCAYISAHCANADSHAILNYSIWSSSLKRERFTTQHQAPFVHRLSRRNKEIRPKEISMWLYEVIKHKF